MKKFIDIIEGDVKGKVIEDVKYIKIKRSEDGDLYIFFKDGSYSRMRANIFHGEPELVTHEKVLIQDVEENNSLFFTDEEWTSELARRKEKEAERENESLNREKNEFLRLKAKFEKGE